MAGATDGCGTRTLTATEEYLMEVRAPDKKRIAELEAFVRECATLSDNVQAQEAWRMLHAVRTNAKALLK